MEARWVTLSLSLSVPTITTSLGAVPSAGIAQAAVLGADETGLFFVELPTKYIAGVGIIPTVCVDDVQGIKTEIHLAQSSQ